jgi:hypothetical protein
MTQTLYAHMNKIKVKKNKIKSPEDKKKTTLPNCQEVRGENDN